MATAEAAVDRVSLTFEAFFEREYAPLVRLAYLLSGDRAEAEEIGQEAMARVYERWDRVRDMESPGGYANRVAVNLYRRRRRLLRRFFPAGGTARDPENGAVARSDIASALRTLPIGERAALVLVVWMGLDASEAGTILGVQPASVRSRIHRAKERLRPLLEDVHE